MTVSGASPSNLTTVLKKTTPNSIKLQIFLIWKTKTEYYCPNNELLSMWQLLINERDAFLGRFLTQVRSVRQLWSQKLDTNSLKCTVGITKQIFRNAHDGVKTTKIHRQPVKCKGIQSEFLARDKSFWATVQKNMRKSGWRMWSEAIWLGVVASLKGGWKYGITLC